MEGPGGTGSSFKRSAPSTECTPDGKHTKFMSNTWEFQASPRGNVCREEGEASDLPSQDGGGLEALRDLDARLNDGLRSGCHDLAIRLDKAIHDLICEGEAIQRAVDNEVEDTRHHLSDIAGVVSNLNQVSPDIKFPATARLIPFVFLWTALRRIEMVAFRKYGAAINSPLSIVKGSIPLTISRSWLVTIEAAAPSTSIHWLEAPV